MTDQEYWRRRYRERRPDWTPSAMIYRSLVRERVDPDGGLLDVGCGHVEVLADIGRPASFMVGVDRDPRAFIQDPAIGGRVAADAERLPFRSGSFRLVVMAWVFEHLDHPRLVLREVERALEPGGSLVFITPNALNYNAWLIRAVPNLFHAAFTKALYGRAATETFPTRYRFNSAGRIDSLLSDLGFARERLVLNGDPTYVAMNETSFRVACAVERVYDLPWFRRARVHLVGAYRKPGFRSGSSEELWGRPDTGDPSADR
jgi:SAM-dependent methyltransferase